ncbi:MAG: hypothetical protein IAC29_01200, partial [Bacteroidetes bacterium]|nr:hypothetical protein [Candidatus Cryptobacteroides merdigallinarum]
SSSFLSFSVAFGVLLSISKLAKKNMDARIAEMQAEQEAAAAAREQEEALDEDGPREEEEEEYGGRTGDTLT